MNKNKSATTNTTTNSKKRRIRVLVLHGWRTNAKIMSTQTARMKKLLNTDSFRDELDFEFVFKYVEAANKATGDTYEEVC